jgi:fibronectin-binding autotransporter adhesin
LIATCRVSRIRAATKATAFATVLLGLISVVGVRAQAPLVETFTNTTYDAGSSAWTANEAAGTTYMPTLTATAPKNGALSLTDANTWEASYIYSNQSFSAANASIYATFQYSSYGGNAVSPNPNADGITFFLFDANDAASFHPGAYGGGLGYAQRDTPIAGLSGGYLGIGLDTYGNYSNPNEGKVGGPGPLQSAIAVRGPEAGGYAYLAGTGTLAGGIDTTDATTFNTVTISITPTNQLSVYMQYAGSSTTQLMLSVDLSAYTRPDDLMFGFTAGTGGSDDNHLIRNLTIAASTTSLWKGVDGSFGNTANWNPNVVPSGSDVLLDNSTVNAAQAIDLGGVNQKVRSVGIDAPFSYTLSNGTLEFLTNSSASGIFLTSTNGAAASQTINANLAFDNAIEIKNNTTSALNIKGNVTTNGYNLTLEGTGSGTTTLSTGAISGAGGFIKNDSGTVVLSGDNSYAGGTTLNAGTLVVGSDHALGNVHTDTVALNGGTLAASGTHTIVNDIALQGNAGLAVIGAGTFTSQGTLTQTGGSFTLNLGDQVTQQGNVNLSDNNTGRTLTVQVDSGTSIVSGTIANGGAGAGSLVKTGAGILQLNNVESYSGGTTISNGTLALGAGVGALKTGTNLSIGGSGTFALNGNSQFLGNLTAQANGATVDLGTGGGNSLVFSSYTAPASGVMVINNYQGSDFIADKLNTDNVGTIYISGFGVAGYNGTKNYGWVNGIDYSSTYLITPVAQTNISWQGNTDVNWSKGSNWFGGAIPGAAQIATFDGTGNTHLNVTLDGDYTVAGVKFASAALQYNITNAVAHTLTLSGTVPYVQQQSASNETLGFTTLAMGNNTVFDVTNSGNLTVSSAITGTYSLIKDGTGTGKLILSGNNTYSGGAFINNGIVQITSATALGNAAHTATIATGAALEVSSASGITAANPISVTGTGVGSAGAIHNVLGSNILSGAITMTGATTVATDTGTTLNLTGNITGSNYGLTLNGTGNLTIGAGATTGVINLGTGGITINSTGTTTFAGTNANNYSGGTTVNSGTLVLGKSNLAGVTSVSGNLIIGDGAGFPGTTIVKVATGAGAQIDPNSAVTINSDGTLNLNGQSNTVAQLNASSANAQVALGAGTITVGGNANLNSAYAGTITGTGGLTKAGSGALTLSNGSSTYSGPTALTSGIINVSAVGALGIGGTTTVTSGASLQVTNLGVLNNLANIVNLNGNGVGGAGAVEATAGTNNLTGNITLQSNARIQADTGSTLNLTTGTLALGAFTLDVSGDGNTTITRIISGTGGVTMDGTGTVALSGTNTYTGATAVNSGTLEIRNNSALGGTGGTTTVANGATLALNNATPIAEVTTTINGAGVGNNGALRNIAGNNTWSGTVALASDSSIGADTGTTLTMSGVISGGHALSKAGAGTVVLNAAETYTGATNVNAGTLQLGASNLIPNTSAVTVASGATLNLNNNSDTVASIAGAGAISLGSGSLGAGGDNTSTTFSGALSGTGNITKNGTGTLTMSGTDSRTAGTTTVTTGALKLGANNALASTSGLTLNGGTFATNGFSDVVNTLYLQASSTIDYGGLAGILTIGPGNGSRNVGTLTINNWNGNLAGGGADQFLVNSATGLTAGLLTNITFAGYGAGAQIISVAGKFEVVPVTGNAYVWANVGGSNWTNPINNWTPNGNPSGAGVSVTFGAAIAANSTVTLDAARTVGYVNFNNSHNYTIAPAAAQSLTMDVGGGSAQINVTNTGSPTISARLVLNDNLIINQDNAGGTLTLSAATAITAGTAQGNITVNGAGNTVISGAITTGAGTLTKNEAGTLTLSGANTYTGTTTINGGVLSINTLANVNGGASSLGAPTTAPNGTIKIGSGATGATLAFTGASNNSTNRVIDLAGTTGGATLDASGGGTITFTSAFTASGAGAKTLTLAGSTNGAISGAIVDNSGVNNTSLFKTGAGTWVLSGANTYTGDTLINVGTLQLGANNVLADTTDVNLTGATAIFDVNGKTDTVGSLTGVAGSTISLGAGALTSGGSNSITTFAGTITGTGTLTQSGTGKLTLTGANTYSGATSITGGVLSVSTLANGGANSNIGASTNAAANLVLNGGTLQYTGGGVSTDRLFTLGTTAGSTIDASGGGTLNFTNTGSVVLSGANTARTLTLTGSNTGALASALSNNGTGATSLTKNGTGTWVLSSLTSNYTGATAINSGILEIQSAAALGNTTGATVASGATLNVNGAGLTVTRNLILNGFGAGANGALHNIGGANIWSGTIALNSSSSIGVDNATTLTANGVVSGAAGNSLTKVGAGTLVLGNAANTYAGLTDVQGGVVSIAAEGDLGATPGAVTANQLTLSGGTLRNTGATALSANRGVTLGASGGTFDTSSTLTVNSIVTGTGSLTKMGASTLTLSAVNTYAGATNITGGTLQLGVANALPSGTAVTNSNGGILALNNNSATVGSIATGTGGGSITLGNATLTTGGNDANTLFAGSISGSGGGLTKTGGGTLTITGASTYTGATTINGSGTLLLGAGGSAMTGGSAVTIASGATFEVENGQAGNTVGLLTANSGSTLKIGSGTLITNGGTIAGALQGSGSLTVQNAGTLTISSNASDLTLFSGGSITVNAGATGSTTLAFASAASTTTIGTITLNGGADAAHSAILSFGAGTYNITNLVVTGYSTIDFGNGVAVTLNGTNFTNSGSLSIANWVNAVDYFFAQNWTGATLDVRNQAPMNLISFTASSASYAASNTAWLPYGSNVMITPAPEPSTYGAIFMGLSLVGLGFRRWRTSRK